MGQNGQAIEILDCNQSLVKTSLCFGPLGALLAFNGQTISLCAGEAIFCRDDIGGNSLRYKVMRHGDRGICGNGGPIAAHRHPAHHFNAACNIGVARTALDLIGRKVDRL